jgi:hypothetical protein
MVKTTFLALIVLTLVCVLLFGATTLTNGGVVYKTFATHPDVPPSGGLLLWAKTDGTFQVTNSSATDSGMGGGSGGAQVMGSAPTVSPGLLLNGSASLYAAPFGGFANITFETLAQQIVSTAGTMSKFCAQIGYTTPQPGDGSLVLTVRKNGADTTLVVTFPASATAPQGVCDNTHTVAVVAGDVISVRVTNNSASASAYIGPFSFFFQ